MISFFLGKNVYRFQSPHPSATPTNKKAESENNRAARRDPPDSSYRFLLPISPKKHLDKKSG